MEKPYLKNFLSFSTYKDNIYMFAIQILQRHVNVKKMNIIYNFSIQRAILSKIGYLNVK